MSVYSGDTGYMETWAGEVIAASSTGAAPVSSLPPATSGGGGGGVLGGIFGGRQGGGVLSGIGSAIGSALGNAQVRVASDGVSILRPPTGRPGEVGAPAPQPDAWSPAVVGGLAVVGAVVLAGLTWIVASR